MNKKLVKSDSEKLICGVCGGIAEYFGIDPTLVRLLFVLFGLMGFGVVFYIIAVFLIPNQAD